MLKFNIIIGLIILNHLSTAQKLPDFDSQTQPAAPDYSLPQMWAALPFRADAADVIPKHETWLHDSLKQVDVFYVHPTIYEKGKTWNADLGDKKLNKKVDKLPVHYQASVFNATGRIYAPRYRQAIVKVFYEPSPDSAKALAFAYQDVKKAFIYYLEHYNQGRPIIIASHSQGTVHARRLLQEFFDTTDLKKQLVAAYVIGFKVNEQMYENLKFCADADDTGCIISWMSYRKGFSPKGKWHYGTQGTNPLTWNTTPHAADKSNNRGTIVLNINKQRIHCTSAQLVDSNGQILWVKTKAPLLKWFKDMHILDYNLFWYDIRYNAAERVKAFMEWKGGEN